MSNVNEAGDQRRSRGTPRWVMGVLLISLMANMIVVGMATGRIWAHHGGHGWFDRHHRKHGEDKHDFLGDVSEARRGELGELIRANRAAVREEREKVHKLRRAVREVMLREPFDKAAVVAALGEVNAARQVMGERFATELANLLERMTPDERKTFVEKGMRRHGGLHEGKH